ncbi:MAG: hypothetical protein PHF97_06225 [Bacteroidales bacterium]|nr:hypothetical protein [Bacteroidales bacterium]MDD4603385.1 hypothetical protein [Bacteroidales bacterium]
METLTHIFASLDIFQVLINTFPSIIKPVVHGFVFLFSSLFTFIKNLIELYPGLVSGVVFMFLAYTLFTLLRNLRKSGLTEKIR